MTIKSKAFVLVVFLFVVCFWPALCWFLDGMFCVFSCSDTLCWENFRVDLGTDSCKRCVELADAPSAGCRGASAVVVCPCSEAVGDPLTVFSDSLSVDFCYYLCFRHERCLELETIFWPFGYFSYLVGGMPDNLDFFMEYSSFDLCVHYMSDLFRYSVHWILGNWVFSADLLYGTVGGLSAFADIRMIGYFLYNHMFMQLLVLGYIFLIVILGVIPLLLNRNLRVKRQEVYEQQKNEMINHLILFY